MTKPRLMITGAAGFLGTAFWRQFQDKYDLIGIDKYGYASHIDGRQGYSGGIAKLDCSNVDAMRKAFHNATHPSMLSYFNSDNARPIDKLLILHAETHNDNSFEGPLEFYNSNVMGFVNVLEAARVYKIPEVYAVITDEVLQHRSPESLDDLTLYYSNDGFEQVARGWNVFYRVLELDGPAKNSYNPTSPYSSSKACQEMIINAYKHSYGMKIITIRPGNIYGPFQHPEKLVSKAITNALQDKRIPIYGVGAQYRSYTYVEDTCSALDLIMSQEEPHHTYHIDTNDERQNIETVKEILRQLDKPEELIEYIEDPRPVHDYSYGLSSERIRKLGWAPKIEFSEGIARTIAYYKDRMSG